MKKTPTIFKRDEVKRNLVTEEINEVCQWVFDGEGKATRKYDGTCCKIQDGKFFKRREVKKGKNDPDCFVLEQEDTTTGKRVGWVPVEENNENQYHLQAFNKLENKEDNELKYAKRVLKVIKNLPPETSFGAVCVLVRKRSEGVVVANYLSENDLAIVSSETLLLSTSEKVNFIINFLKYTLQPNDKESLLEVLYFLHKHLIITSNKHTFFTKFIHLKQTEVLALLKKYNCFLDLILFHESPFYEKVEQVIRAFHLQDTTDAYVQFFLDEILIQQQKESNIQDFLKSFHKKQ